MLTGGFYAEVTLGYDPTIALEKGGRPFAVEGLRAIQLSKNDVLEVLAGARDKFTSAEWKDLLLRSVGLEPTELTDRAKDAMLLRMVPFVERNYNMWKLGHAARVNPTYFSRCPLTRTWCPVAKPA